MNHILVINTPHGALAAYIRDTEDEARALREKIGSMGIWGKEATAQLYEAKLIDEIKVSGR
jgi:hypothetical protein